MGALCVPSFYFLALLIHSLMRMLFTYMMSLLINVEQVHFTEITLVLRIILRHPAYVLVNYVTPIHFNITPVTPVPGNNLLVHGFIMKG